MFPHSLFWKAVAFLTFFLNYVDELELLQMQENA